MHNAVSNKWSYRPTRLTCVACYDASGAEVDCAGGKATYYLDPQNNAVDLTSGITISGNNPVATGAATSNGPSSLNGLFTSILNFGSTIAKSVTGPSTSSGLRLQVNPATGLQQYYNPATGAYVGSPIQPSGGLLGGSNSFLLVIAALVVAFFAFSGRKKLAA